MWTCEKCGEELEEQFDVCWKCGTPRSGREPLEDPAPVATGDSALAGVTDRELLERILETQTAQKAELALLQSRVGCLYYALIATLIPVVVLLIFSALFR